MKIKLTRLQALTLCELAGALYTAMKNKEPVAQVPVRKQLSTVGVLRSLGFMKYKKTKQGKLVEITPRGWQAYHSMLQSGLVRPGKNGYVSDSKKIILELRSGIKKNTFEQATQERPEAETEQAQPPQDVGNAGEVSEGDRV